MAKDRDGIYKRKDRDGFWMRWTNAQGKRKTRKVNAPTLTEARKALAAELFLVDKAKCLGLMPPGEETFSEVTKKFLTYQKARLTDKSYEPESGIIHKHLVKFFTGQVANIRRVDIQRY